MIKEIKENIKDYHKQLLSVMKQFLKDLKHTFILLSCISMIVLCVKLGFIWWCLKFCVGITFATYLFLFILGLMAVVYKSITNYCKEKRR